MSLGARAQEEEGGGDATPGPRAEEEEGAADGQPLRQDQDLSRARATLGCRPSAASQRLILYLRTV